MPVPTPEQIADMRKISEGACHAEIILGDDSSIFIVGVIKGKSIELGHVKNCAQMVVDEFKEKDWNNCKRCSKMKTPTEYCFICQYAIDNPGNIQE